MRIGPYEVQVTARANCRRMILRWKKQENRLLLSVPRGTTERQAREFLEKNLEWMRRTVGQPQQWTARYEAGERHWCMGRLVTLGREAPAGESAFRRWRDQLLLAEIRRQLTMWTVRMGVRVTHVTLREMSSRCGSCRSGTGRLTFNTRLGLYDAALIEETVVHEMCHFFHGNHSPAFYAEMTRWLPDWRSRKQRRDAMDVRPLPPQ